MEPYTVEEIRRARARLGTRVVTTPVHELQGPAIEETFGAGTQALLKLELLQRTGSFKPRGALLNMLALDADALRRGVCAISAGNHAIATAFAASLLGSSAKIVMTASANPFRVAACRRYGAEVEIAADVHQGFARVEQIRESEGRAFIHPFEGRTTALGTATLGLEFCEQAPMLDAVIVPIGGGGLCAGVAAAFKLIEPRCEVFGVEPEGADSMYRSFAAGSPQPIERVATIADSLGAPYALPITFEICRRNVDGLARVTDAQLVEAMRFLLEQAKLAVEPAGAAATAALMGPLRERLAGKRVGLVVCGSNIDAASYARLIA
ncbi:MAG: threonine/serine dehydratase [Gammaproteobacteria bacterium]|nr:threonine/serine dehydratase [Gammaproteobacteria bacterium]